RRLSKQLTSVSLGELCRVLEYKAKIYGKNYLKIDSYYPSSQECSKCGYKNEKVKDLRVREWTCPECGSYHDRDYNASYNIMFEGLKKYMMELK
ncbi:MAG TPA: transposase, partial [Candidatus Faecimonas gallistercoris]|nr:transposase [Candidatus Faecimonas gallistercoris]